MRLTHARIDKPQKLAYIPTNHEEIMLRLFVVLLITITFFGCSTVSHDPNQTTEPVAFTQSGLDVKPLTTGAVVLDERTPPKVDIVWPESRGTILMYPPGTPSQFTIQARVNFESMDLITAVCTIAVPGESVARSLLAYTSHFDESGICEFLFRVDASDLACRCEHELTVYAFDSKGTWGGKMQPVNFLWE